MNIVILGAPASGKGTQAELLSKRLALYHFQTGELARNLAKKNARIKKIVESGKLIPEEEMTMYALDYLKDKRSDFSDILFEGFPRFVSQYKALEEFLKEKGDDIDAVISLDIDENVAIKRLSSRRVCERCGEVYNLITNPPSRNNKCGCGGKLIRRKDDNPKSIKVRFKYYKESVEKLVDYLTKEGKLIHIDADRPIEVIFKDILKQLEVRR